MKTRLLYPVTTSLLVYLNENKTLKQALGEANGIATLNDKGKIKPELIPDSIAGLSEYDNSQSGLEATTVQGAIDELAARKGSGNTIHEVLNLEMSDSDMKWYEYMYGEVRQANHVTLNSMEELPVLTLEIPEGARRMAVTVVTCGDISGIVEAWDTMHCEGDYPNPIFSFEELPVYSESLRSQATENHYIYYKEPVSYEEGHIYLVPQSVGGYVWEQGSGTLCEFYILSDISSFTITKAPISPDPEVNPGGSQLIPDDDPEEPEYAIPDDHSGVAYQENPHVPIDPILDLVNIIYINRLEQVCKIYHSSNPTELIDREEDYPVYIRINGSIYNYLTLNEVSYPIPDTYIELDSDTLGIENLYLEYLFHNGEFELMGSVSTNTSSDELDLIQLNISDLWSSKMGRSEYISTHTGSASSSTRSYSASSLNTFDTFEVEPIDTSDETQYYRDTSYRVGDLSIEVPQGGSFTTCKDEATGNVKIIGSNFPISNKQETIIGDTQGTYYLGEDLYTWVQPGGYLKFYNYSSSRSITIVYNWSYNREYDEDTEEYDSFRTKKAIGQISLPAKSSIIFRKSNLSGDSYSNTITYEIFKGVELDPATLRTSILNDVDTKITTAINNASSTIQTNVSSGIQSLIDTSVATAKAEILEIINPTPEDPLAAPDGYKISLYAPIPDYYNITSGGYVNLPPGASTGWLDYTIKRTNFSPTALGSITINSGENWTSSGGGGSFRLLYPFMQIAQLTKSDVIIPDVNFTITYSDGVEFTHTIPGKTVKANYPVIIHRSSNPGAETSSFAGPTVYEINTLGFELKGFYTTDSGYVNSDHGYTSDTFKVILYGEVPEHVIENDTSGSYKDYIMIATKGHASIKCLGIELLKIVNESLTIYGVPGYKVYKSKYPLTKGVEVYVDITNL